MEGGKAYLGVADRMDEDLTWCLLGGEAACSDRESFTGVSQE